MRPRPEASTLDRSRLANCQNLLVSVSEVVLQVSTSSILKTTRMRSATEQD